MSSRSYTKNLSKQFVRDGATYEITVKYGFQYLGANDGAYLSVTAEERRKARNGRWVFDSCGQLRDDVREHFSDAPEMIALLPFHLSSVVSGPMHYLANARHWWDYFTSSTVLTSHERDEVNHRGEESVYHPRRALQVFKNHVLWGILPDDDLNDLEPLLCIGHYTASRAWDVAWEGLLERRLPLLLAELQKRAEAAGFDWQRVLDLRKEPS